MSSYDKITEHENYTSYKKYDVYGNLIMEKTIFKDGTIIERRDRILKNGIVEQDFYYNGNHARKIINYPDATMRSWMYVNGDEIEDDSDRDDYEQNDFNIAEESRKHVIPDRITGLFNLDGEQYKLLPENWKFVPDASIVPVYVHGKLRYAEPNYTNRFSEPEYDDDYDEFYRNYKKR